MIMRKNILMLDKKNWEIFAYSQIFKKKKNLVTKKV